MFVPRTKEEVSCLAFEQVVIEIIDTVLGWLEVERKVFILVHRKLLHFMLMNVTVCPFIFFPKILPSS